jgi:hypothetical protein
MPSNFAQRTSLLISSGAMSFSIRETWVWVRPNHFPATDCGTTLAVAPMTRTSVGSS